MPHGGPGGAPRSGLPRLVDPDAYRVVHFHQRGCGRSTRHAGDLDTSLQPDTTRFRAGVPESERDDLVAAYDRLINTIAARRYGPAPHTTGARGRTRSFPSTTGRTPGLDNWAHAYYGTNLHRLLRVKPRYDPGNVLHFHQSLPTG